MLLFATAANPADIPADAPNGQDWYGAAPYATGYPWPLPELRRFPNRFSIIQTPRDLAMYARHARCIDVEYLAVTPEEVEAFCNERNALYHDATVYCSENTFEAIHHFDPDLDFRLYAALWDNDPFTRPVWHGKKAWAKQYEAFPGHESSALYARNFDSAT